MRPSPSGQQDAIDAGPGTPHIATAVPRASDPRIRSSSLHVGARPGARAPGRSSRATTSRRPSRPTCGPGRRPDRRHPLEPLEDPRSFADEGPRPTERAAVGQPGAPASRQCARALSPLPQPHEPWTARLSPSALPPPTLRVDNPSTDRESPRRGRRRSNRPGNSQAQGPVGGTTLESSRRGGSPTVKGASTAPKLSGPVTEGGTHRPTRPGGP